jgi:TolA-binding protein
VASKIDKETLKGPDVFLSTSEKVFQWVEHNLVVIGSIVGVGLAVACGIVGYNYFVGVREQKAAEALYVPEAEFKKAQSEMAEAKQKDKLAQQNSAASKTTKGKNKDKNKDRDKDKDKPSDGDTSATDKKIDLEPMIAKIKTQIDLHSQTRAAMVSAMNLSNFLLTEKRYADALAVLDLIKYDPGSADLLAGFWLMHRGLIYLENTKSSQARECYQRVLESPQLNAFHPEALLKLGVAFETEGDLTKARDYYERVGREFPNTEDSTTAQQYIRLLELAGHQKPGEQG